MTRKGLFSCVLAVGIISMIAISAFVMYQPANLSIVSLGKGVRVASARKLWSHVFPHQTFEESTVSPTTISLETTEMPCRETSNFVFIKTHKTGSTTLRSLTSRFGYFRNLSFLLGKGGIIGHLNTITLNMKKTSSNVLPPIGVKEGDYDNYRNYNISNIHVRFNKDNMKKIMYPSTDLKYITILREPAEQWLSNFQYYKGYKKFGLNLVNISQALLPLLLSAKGANMKFNRQSVDLGIGSKSLTNISSPSLNETIHTLDQLLSLTLITEYFDESLLVLKKLFCWSFNDILYVKKRAQPNPIVINEETKKELRRRSWADVILYEYFVDVLWEKVSDYGPHFQRDLQTFRKLLNDTLNTCVEKSVAEKSIDHYLYIETYGSTNTSTFCWAFVNARFHMDIEMVRRQGRESDKRWINLDY